MSDEEEEEDDDSLNPIGFEFWIGQTGMIVGVIVGILIAAYSAFHEASSFSKHEDYRQAERALAAVKREFESNLRAVREARDALRDGKKARLDLRTRYLEAAPGQPYMSLVDPLLLAEILKIFGFPVSDAAGRLKQAGLTDEERSYAVEVFERAMARAEKDVMPMLEKELARLRRLQERTGEAP